MQSIIAHGVPRYNAIESDINTIKNEADLIVTSTFVGFVARQFQSHKKVQIDWEAPPKNEKEEWNSEKQEYLQVIARLNTILGTQGYVSVGQSPDSTAHGIIVGLPSELSERERNEARNYMVPRDPGTRSYSLPGIGVSLCELVATSSEEYFGEGIDQRGAYIGMLMSEDRSHMSSQIVEPTHRVYVNHNPWKPTAEYQGWGTMRASLGKNQTDLARNSTNNSVKNPTDKFGKAPSPEKWNSSEYRIGYLHGMTIAIGHATYRNNEERRQRYWPVEVIAGTKTTKVASCFACTTYMIAAGFPPTSMHLGRSESWVPPAFGYLETAEMSHRIVSQGTREQFRDYYRSLDQEKVIDSQINFVNVWRDNIFSYIDTGFKILANAKINETMNLPLRRLEDILSPKLFNSSEEHKEKVSNMYLDALTVHKKDWERLKNVFGI
ncbi:hypothetical protein [Roseofilum sp. Belize Diploria]|uniref:hypothetical protein n=1 Tax=Roseofilum sp. Belize Diploria TaxID=2821501 RepID=UPI001B20CA37|nr:hypothetical protein [Roseofilum sp. Belize Diploria]MBP0009252.1 hypothetical protein [Roseofilum sp. Belize Diploria]